LNAGGSGDRHGMKIYSKRNALVGAMTLFFARRYAKRRMHTMTGRLKLGR